MSSNNIMNKTSKNIIDFLNENKITWGYVSRTENNLTYWDTKGKGKYDKPYCSTFNPESFKGGKHNKVYEKYVNKETWIKKVVEKTKKYPTKEISYDTSQIHCVDVDDINLNCDSLKSKYFYSLSKNKRLPHFFCVITNKDNLKLNRCRTVVKKIDVLTCQGSYLWADEKVIGSYDKIENLDLSDIWGLYNISAEEAKTDLRQVQNDDTKKLSINRPKPNISDDIIYLVFSNLSNKRYEDYENWFQIGSWLKWFYDSSPEKALQLFKMFSSKSTRQKDKELLYSDKFDNKFNSFSVKIVYKFYSFLIWLKEDNNDKYIEAQAKLSGDKKCNHIYEIKKEEFEKEHFHIITCNQFFKKIDDKWIGYNKKNFVDIVAEYDYEIEGKYGSKSVGFFTKWLKDRKRRKFNYIDWVPTFKQVPNTYNEFTGFKLDDDYEEYDEEAVHTYLKHIKFLCNENEEYFTYLLYYIAHLFQHPEQRAEVAILFKSIEGTGKDLFIDILQAIIGEEYCLRVSPTDIKRSIFGSSNGAMKHKLLLQFDEIKSKDGYQYIDDIKNLITASHINIKELYKDNMKYTNYLRIFFSTNNENPIKIKDTSRRFFILKILKIMPKSYYQTLGNLLKNKNGLKSILSFFKKLDIGDYHPSKNMPKTEFLKEMAQFNRPLIYEWLEEFTITQKKDKKFYMAVRLLKDYQSFLMDNGYKDYNINSKNFKSMLEVVEGIEYKRSRQGRGYELNKKNVIDFIKSKFNDDIPFITSDEETEDDSDESDDEY